MPKPKTKVVGREFLLRLQKIIRDSERGTIEKLHAPDPLKMMIPNKYQIYERWCIACKRFGIRNVKICNACEKEEDYELKPTYALLTWVWRHLYPSSKIYNWKAYWNKYESNK